MSLRGGCQCNNIQVHWHTVDLSLVPRACQCDYCSGKNAAYVSKSGTRIDVLIHREAQHRIHTQGSGTAQFHECAACGDLVLVTTEIDGQIYGALNAPQLHNKAGFAAAVDMDCSAQGVQEKQLRWRQNWCCPVQFTCRNET